MSFVFYDLPGPPDGEAWCQACVMLAKGKLDNLNRAGLDAAAADGREDVKFLKFRLSPPLQVARVRGPWSGMEQLGAGLELCWTHVAGVTPAGRLARADGLPPGLIRGAG